MSNGLILRYLVLARGETGSLTSMGLSTARWGDSGVDTRKTATNFNGWVAQVVEQWPEKPRVGGANTLSATNCDNEVKWYARAYAGSMD